MVRYNYSRSVEPPAPFVHVTIRNPAPSQSIADVPALLDSAADRSVIPATIVEQLELVQIDEVPIMGFGGHLKMSPTYLAEFSIRQLDAVTVEVIADSDEPYVILGRDVLNSFRVLLDGPNLVVEIQSV